MLSSRSSSSNLRTQPVCRLLVTRCWDVRTNWFVNRSYFIENNPMNLNLSRKNTKVYIYKSSNYKENILVFTTSQQKYMSLTFSSTRLRFTRRGKKETAAASFLREQQIKRASFDFSALREHLSYFYDIIIVPEAHR